MRKEHPKVERRKAIIAVVLTVVGGFVDAVGYLVLRNIFASNMSGNSIGMGMHFAQGNWTRGWERGWPILMFVVGIVIGSTFFELARRCKIRRLLTATMALEGALIAALLALGVRHFGWFNAGVIEPGDKFLLLAALAAAAMGVQNAGLRQVGALTIYTTFVTGTVTKFAEDLVAYLFWFGERFHRRKPSRMNRLFAASRRQPAIRETVLLFSIWFAYVAGAAAGVVFRNWWGMTCLAWPLGVVIIIGVTDVVSPCETGGGRIRPQKAKRSLS